jgi:hypothetical protein
MATSSRNSGPSLSSLIYAFAWRWLISAALAWVAGIITLIILTIIVSIIVAVGTGATTPEALEKPVSAILAVLMVPIVFVLIPGLSAVIAFVWVLYSPQVKAMVQVPGSSSQPTPYPGTTGVGTGAGQGSGTDPYTQYTQAYQRWQKDYAAFQESKKAQAEPAPESTISASTTLPAVMPDTVPAPQSLSSEQSPSSSGG